MKDRSALLATARNAQNTEGGRAILNLLKAQVEHWKNVSIGMPLDQVAQYHGAIMKVRELINEIETEPRPKKFAVEKTVPGF